MKIYVLFEDGETHIFINKDDAKEFFKKREAKSKRMWKLTDDLSPIHEIEFNKSVHIEHTGMLIT